MKTFSLFFYTGNPQTTPMIPVTRPPHHNTSTTELSTTTLLPTRPTKPSYAKPTTTTTTTTTTSTTTTTTPRPTTTARPPSAEYFKVVCYFTNWAWYRFVMIIETRIHDCPRVRRFISFGFSDTAAENIYPAISTRRFARTSFTGSRYWTTTN